VLENERFLKANGNVYSKMIDGVKCGVDFATNEFFWMDDLERMVDENNDGVQ
jgi:hypothetical protein